MPLYSAPKPSAQRNPHYKHRRHSIHFHSNADNGTLHYPRDNFQHLLNVTGYDRQPSLMLCTPSVSFRDLLLNVHKTRNQGSSLCREIYLH
jgi:hypothetical protein